MYILYIELDNFQKMFLILGQFYAPDQPEERVLSMSSDQPKNKILVSGDTAGWLQIWDISDYALDTQHEVSLCEIKKMAIFSVCLYVPEIFSFYTVSL